MTPNITSFYPLTAFPGEKVTIIGAGFTDASSVQFGGYNALTFRVISDTLIEAYLGLDGTGIVSVTNYDGTGYLAGFTQQKIKKKIPEFPALGRPAVSADKVLVWADSEAKTTYANVSDLPFSSGGGGGGSTGGGSSLPSQFAVRSSDYPVYQYDSATDTTIITDARLIGKTDYMVSSTQLGGSEFRDDVLTYDPVAGNVKIAGFKLNPGEKIRINADGNGGQAYAALIAQLSLFSQALAPLLPTATGANGAKLLWLRPASEIPTGWQEVTDMRGVLPMGQDPGDSDFSSSVGTTGGAKSVKMTSGNLISHDHDYRVVGLSGVQGDRLENDVLKRDDDIGLYLGQTKKTAKTGNTDPDPINVLNPFRIVMWIEFVGTP